MEVYEKFAETFLYHIWDEGHFEPRRLQTTDGHRLEIIFRGRWNLDAGPDFRGALIKIAGRLAKGDVEIHLREADWFQHQHHQDSRYNRVVLHVVMWNSDRPAPAVTADGRLVPTLVISHYLDESVSRLHVRRFPPFAGAAAEWPESCLLRDKEEAAKRVLLQKWGAYRIGQKQQRFAEQRRFFPYNELFYQGVCEALGYAKNQRPFLRLAILLPLGMILRISDEQPQQDRLFLLQALLFGAAGFLTDGEGFRQAMPAENRRLWQSFSRLWKELRETYRIGEMAKKDWLFFRLRPNNFPTVRLAGLAGLLQRVLPAGFLDPVLDLFRDLGAAPRKLFSELQRLFVLPGYGFWKTHFRFEDSPHSRQVRAENLIGPDLAREIVINVVLPVILAYAEETEDYTLKTACRELLLQAPKLQSNALTRRLAKLAGLPQKTYSACEQQGMLHLAKTLCPGWRCRECLRPPELS